MAEMVRVNTRISYDANKWLDERSEASGLPKSTLIMLAIEQYINSQDAMKRMGDLGELVQAIQSLEEKVTKQNSSEMK